MSNFQSLFNGKWGPIELWAMPLQMDLKEQVPAVSCPQHQTSVPQEGMEMIF